MVAGDVVNTASRLQQHAPVGEIVVGAETHLATRAAIEYEPVEPVTAKGKAKPIAVWRALGATSALGERDLSTTPFVGRDREIGLLDATWERVELERRPHLITVLGPPGVGKSRLAAEFMERIASRGGRVVSGRCLPYRERSAYGAFASQVKQLRASSTATTSTWRREAAHARRAARRHGGGRGGRRAPRDPARIRDEDDDSRPRQPLPVGARLHRGGRARRGDGVRLRGHPLGGPGAPRPDRAPGRALARTCPSCS